VIRLARRAFLAALAALWLAASAAAQDERVIVAFGDSLTAGYGVAPEESYPALLGARLREAGYRYRVINAGVSGDTTAGGLRRVDWALKLKPEIALVELGANDALRGQDLEKTRANLDAIVARFEAGGARVLLLGMRLPPNYGGRYARAFEKMYEDVARAAQGAADALLPRRGGRGGAAQPVRRHPSHRRGLPRHRRASVAEPHTSSSLKNHGHSA
jgi:acyl-CoA thioesterase-1